MRLNVQKFWQAKPFPHLIIDNWFDRDQYEDIIAKAYGVHSDPAAVFNTSIERGKTTYDQNSELGRLFKPFVDRLTSKEFMGELQELTGLDRIIPLTKYTDTIDYKFFHQMKSGGILGPHADHSQVYRKDGTLVDGKIHFLNTIFYAVSHAWDSPHRFGGSTELYGKRGLGKALAQVECVPNRLLIFLHSSESFHGVSQIGDLVDPRTSIYMDYYIDKEQISDLQQTARKYHSEFRPQFWRHRTTFVPKDLKNLHRYLPWYLEWMMRRRL
jgi:hypothetical protein